MGGGLVQLVAIGAQDVYLTSQPQITFFKSVYRRHTNYAMESVAQTINGTAKFGNKISVTISRNGDLLKNLWLQYNPREVLGGIYPANLGDVIGANIGHSIIEYAELEIGGQLIDRMYGKWLTIWNYLTEVNPTGSQGSPGNDWEDPGFYDSTVEYGGERATKYDIMAYTHRGCVCTQESYLNGEDILDSDDKVIIRHTPTFLPPDEAYVPMRFWFCRNPGLALPLIALNYSEVKLNIKFGLASGVYSPITTPTPLLNPRNPNAYPSEFRSLQIYADYIYLDTTERRQFAQNAHEYLIDQLQIIENTTDTTIDLRAFKHPVKELIWSPIPKPVAAAETVGEVLASNENRSQYWKAIPGMGSPNSELRDGYYTLNFSGTDRFTSRNIKYFTRTQVWDHHTGYGSILFPNSIAVYSFSLRPEEHQPSGTCNFSRIDFPKIIRTTNDAIDVYAINYNILRIMSGQGGLAYTN